MKSIKLFFDKTVDEKQLRLTCVKLEAGTLYPVYLFINNLSVGSLMSSIIDLNKFQYGSVENLE